MTTIPGLYALGESNFSDHGSNRLGASALMQGLADGYFVIPYTLGDYLAKVKSSPIETSHLAFKEAKDSVISRINKLLSIKGKKNVYSFHKELGKIMWDYCGMSRSKEGLLKAKEMIQSLKDSFWKDALVTGDNSCNMVLEKANRVADFLELGEIMVEDALNREESCGGHFRNEHQTPENEALRNDKDFSYVAA